MNQLALRGSVPSITITNSAPVERDKLIAQLSRIKTVASPAQLEHATAALREARRITKEVESSRKEVKAPVAKLAKTIDTMAEEFVQPLNDAADAVSELVDQYVAKVTAEQEAAQRAAREAAAKIEAERARASLEAEQKLQAELARARTEAARTRALERAEDRQEVAAAAAAEAFSSLPVAPVLARPEGLSVRTEPEYEVLDIRALYAARPEFCRLEVNAAALRAALRGGLRNCPGLRIWEVTTGRISSKS